MRSPQVLALLFGRDDENSNILPSGDHRGAELSVLGEVIRIGSPPPVPTIHTSECRLLSASRTVAAVNATHFPSGDTAGPDTVVSRYQSFGVKARP